MNWASHERLPDGAMEKLIEYRNAPSEEAADELVRCYEPLVAIAANKIARGRPDLKEDLLQVGRMCLFRLLSQYDPDFGIPFEAYAMKSMIGQMKNYLRDKSWYVQVPRRIKEKGLVIQQTIDELTVRLERSPNVEEIAQTLQMEVEETLEVLAGRELYHYVSLDTPISEEENKTTLAELISSPANDYEGVDKRIDLEEAMERLKPEERQVLQLLYRDGFTQRSAAELLDVSQMSISRIQRRAIERLRKLLGEDEGS